ncbi:MAG: clan AA aspartic protease [Magnetococcales bacterium]|nr:clan AA aspartic protease [Magnetococcales bacterium]
MEITHVTVRLSNLAADGLPYEADFLVDTGAIDCLVPASRLREAGVREEGRAVYELANGNVVEYTFGFARIGFMGAETVGQVVFGPEGCEPILGVVALENTGIGIDPATRTLERLPAKPIK